MIVCTRIQLHPFNSIRIPHSIFKIKIGREIISVYHIPLCPYLSFSNGSATVGTHCYYVTGGHHGNKSPPTPPNPPPPLDTERVTIQDNTSYKKLHGMVQQATNGPEPSVSCLE